MNEFLKWWYTDSQGNEYMSLMHCANGDYFVVILLGLGCLGIIFQYGDIAYRHFVNAHKYPSTKLSKYFLGITKVFIACLITGYSYRIISVWVNPYKFFVLLLFLLNLITYRFRKVNKGLNVFHRIHELETRFGEIKKKVADISDSIVFNLFIGKDKIQLIPFSALDKVPFDSPFDSDGRGVIVNTRVNKELPGFNATSIMQPNSYIQPHQHDTDKILKCTKGKFYDSKTGKWYKEGDYLLIKAYDPEHRNKHWHDIKTSHLETELLTFIMPKI